MLFVHDVLEGECIAGVDPLCLISARFVEWNLLCAPASFVDSFVHSVAFGLKVILCFGKCVPCMVAEPVLIDNDNRYPSSLVARDG